MFSCILRSHFNTYEKVDIFTGPYLFVGAREVQMLFGTYWPVEKELAKYYEEHWAPTEDSSETIELVEIPRIGKYMYNNDTEMKI